jgi:hypothetical protein
MWAENFIIFIHAQQVGLLGIVWIRRKKAFRNPGFFNVYIPCVFHQPGISQVFFAKVLTAEYSAAAHYLQYYIAGLNDEAAERTGCAFDPFDIDILLGCFCQCALTKITSGTCLRNAKVSIARAAHLPVLSSVDIVIALENQECSRGLCLTIRVRAFISLRDGG